MDYRLTEPFEPENESEPEDDVLICAGCDGIIPAGQPHYHRAYDRDAFCEDCWNGVCPADAYDDSEFDGERE